VELARLDEAEATEIALAHPKVAAWLDRYPPDPTTDAEYRRDSETWLVKAWSGEAGQIAQAVVQDRTGQVTEAWTGPQVAWKMARGREGAFGGKTLLSPYVWIGLCLVFLAGLADLRRPLSTRNADLLRCSPSPSRSSSSTAARSSAASRSSTRCSGTCSREACGSASGSAAHRFGPCGRRGRSLPRRCSCSGSGWA
jgi:hypothetical protein